MNTMPELIEAEEYENEMSDFNLILLSYINGNKNWVSNTYQKMDGPKQERFLDFLLEETNPSLCRDVFGSLLKRMTND